MDIVGGGKGCLFSAVWRPGRLGAGLNRARTPNLFHLERNEDSINID